MRQRFGMSQVALLPDSLQVPEAAERRARDVVLLVDLRHAAVFFSHVVQVVRPTTALPGRSTRRAA